MIHSDAQQIVDFVIAYASSQLKKIRKDDPEREREIKRLCDEISSIVKKQ